MVKAADPLLDHARQSIRSAGIKVTDARVRVLAALHKSRDLMSHHDIERMLGSDRVDRVTLYRVLDMLVAHGFAHRIAGTDRVWRFGLAGGTKPGTASKAHDHHAHFQCRDCGKVVCLREAPPAGRSVRVPRGYRPETVELTVKGRCPRCAQ